MFLKDESKVKPKTFNRYINIALQPCNYFKTVFSFLILCEIACVISCDI